MQEVLDALEAPPIDDEARLALQRMLFRCERLRSINPRLAIEGRARVTLVIRTIIESEGNRDALTEPVIQAVSIAMRTCWTDRGLAWIEAFDRIPLRNIVSTMRSLNLFKEEEIGYYLSIVLSNKLTAILGPAPSTTAEPITGQRRYKSPGVVSLGRAKGGGIAKGQAG